MQDPHPNSAPSSSVSGDEWTSSEYDDEVSSLGSASPEPEQGQGDSSWPESKQGEGDSSSPEPQQVEGASSGVFDTVAGNLVNGGLEEGEPSMSGVFYHTVAGDPVYAGFNQYKISNPPLRFLPNDTAVMASAAGLLCCRNRGSKLFYVVNPHTEANVVLPAPNDDHGVSVDVVLIPGPKDDEGKIDYHLVCVYPIKKADGNFDLTYSRIEYFSSRLWEWTRSNVTIDPEIQSIVPDSGVAALGAACWRTKNGAVIMFDPNRDDELVETFPTERGDLWELAGLGRRLYCSALQGRTIVISEYISIGRWKVERREVVGEESPSPLRSQGTSELLFWQVGYSTMRYVIARNLLNWWGISLDDPNPKPQPGVTLVQYVSSYHGLKRDPKDPEVDESSNDTGSQREIDEHEQREENVNAGEVEEDKSHESLQPDDQLKADLEGGAIEACGNRVGDEEVKEIPSNDDELDPTGNRVGDEEVKDLPSHDDELDPTGNRVGDEEVKDLPSHDDEEVKNLSSHDDELDPTGNRVGDEEVKDLPSNDDELDPTALQSNKRKKDEGHELNTSDNEETGPSKRR